MPSAIETAPVDGCEIYNTILTNKRKYLTYWSMNTFFWQENQNALSSSITNNILIDFIRCYWTSRNGYSKIIAV
jgi:hypothetical protein